jgi:hypothetical protein
MLLFELLKELFCRCAEVSLHGAECVLMCCLQLRCLKRAAAQQLILLVLMLHIEQLVYPQPQHTTAR